MFGALVGGASSLAGAWLQSHQSARQQRRAGAEEIEGLLGAIHAELTVLIARYRTRVAPMIRKIQPGEYVNIVWPTQQYYFTVYNANAGLLGRITDATLRNMIVSTYISAKGLLDTLTCNSASIEEYELAVRMETPRDPDAEASLIAYSQAVRQAGEELEAEADALLAKLAKRLKITNALAAPRTVGIDE